MPMHTGHHPELHWSYDDNLRYISLNALLLYKGLGHSEPLGEGGCGEVFTATIDGTEYAVKLERSLVRAPAPNLIAKKSCVNT
jgi:hypothetical protein